MKWKGRELETIWDLCNTMEEIRDGEDPSSEAEVFMRLYRKENQMADANIGYLCGYFGDRLEMQRLFGVTHPILGDREVTAEEAFKLGQEMGEAMRGAP